MTMPRKVTVDHDAPLIDRHAPESATATTSIQPAIMLLPNEHLVQSKRNKVLENIYHRARIPWTKCPYCNQMDSIILVPVDVLSCKRTRKNRLPWRPTPVTYVPQQHDHITCSRCSMTYFR